MFLAVTISAISFIKAISSSIAPIIPIVFKQSSPIKMVSVFILRTKVFTVKTK